MNTRREIIDFRQGNGFECGGRNRRKHEEMIPAFPQAATGARYFLFIYFWLPEEDGGDGAGNSPPTVRLSPPEQQPQQSE